MGAPIEDYALIGDCQTAALVSRRGSIDWLCLPRFDSPACFAALIGEPDNGRWLLSAADENARVARRYREDTLVLETSYETDGGAATVYDFMPPRDVKPDLVRIVVGRRGTVRMKTEVVIRTDYGSVIPWVRRDDGGFTAIAGPDALHLRSPVQLLGENYRTCGEFDVAAGERMPFVLTWFPSFEDPPEPIDPNVALEETDHWWRAWTDRCTYEGPWRDAVVRSLITLKALTHTKTGGIVAAPTTSLPEVIGGERNWDYRFCWIRDATFTLCSLLSAGYFDEAVAWRDWLVRAVAGQPSQMHVVYGIAGERQLWEHEIPWLAGYEHSRPVRVGNNAYRQSQLDVYGEIMDALHLARRKGMPANENAWRVQRALLEHLGSEWRKTDHGLWEVRGPRQFFTHSKVMAWVAFDRAVKAVEECGREGPVEKWRAIRQEIHDEVCRRGFNSDLNTFTQTYDGNTVDASLLMMALVGFLPATDRRIQGTIGAIERTLVRDGFVARYRCDETDDGLSGHEGTFLLCTFWLADNYALANRDEDARRTFERLLSIRNDVGLLAEEYDADNRRMLGNFPQAFSHVALINTAANVQHLHAPSEERAEG
jgi:GH15 family glucan-1,4-alpha-glucosidase